MITFCFFNNDGSVRSVNQINACKITSFFNKIFHLIILSKLTLICILNIQSNGNSPSPFSFSLVYD